MTYRNLPLFAAATLIPGAANAVNVDFSATLTNSCTLTVTTSGVMTPAASGTQIGSEQSGGVTSVMGVAAVGSLPTVSFTAPTLAASPSGWTDASTKEIRYTSISANQAYTSSASSHVQTALTDVYQINGRVTNTAGFAAGTYTLRTVATCS